MNEQLLIRRAQQGDQSAFEALMSTHAQYIYNLALRTVNDAREAEDIAQEAMVRIWRALPSFRAEAKLTTWIYRIVTNLCYNRLPKVKADFAALDPDEDVSLSDTSQRVESGFLNSELRTEIYQAIEELPEGYRLLISLRHLQGMSYQEIADVTNQPLGTVKTGIFRARRELKAALLPYVTGGQL